jgi:H+/Cl- antiporter ClcA
VGTGYQQTKAILHNLQPMEPSYPFLKMLATCATFFSGIPSGIFVPSLVSGAGLGVDLAKVSNRTGFGNDLTDHDGLFLGYAASAAHVLCDRHGND